MGHAKAIAGAPENMQVRLLKRCVKRALSVRQAEEAARAMAAKNDAATAATAEEETYPESYVRLVEQLERMFSQNISIKRAKNGAGGRITIDFSSDGEIEEFLARFESQR